MRLAALREMHEVAELERIFTQLSAAGVHIEDWSLLQEESVTGERLPTRFCWKATPEKGEPILTECPNVAGILRSLHECGRRGIEIKRFKGLGEMDAEQLWDTTMDPSRRALLRVTIEAAAEASNLFTVLMGENVEQRRSYIERHALDVKNLDV